MSGEHRQPLVLSPCHCTSVAILQKILLLRVSTDHGVLTPALVNVAGNQDPEVCNERGTAFTL
ncbi:hypothetical protein I79_007127 [Cricetulus griseus]|uniref:Uncharacterized protein n=1 Tax=Cricetulus griseus TaxID=10029 RepID=G3H9P8_CRIGR|nr:hypothetical protein I79_007127 [Cricetulus griseus]